MHLPKLDPNLVAWATLTADALCVLASFTAAYAAVRVWLMKIREVAERVAKKI